MSETEYINEIIKQNPFLVINSFKNISIYNFTPIDENIKLKYSKNINITNINTLDLQNKNIIELDKTINYIIIDEYFCNFLHMMFDYTAVLEIYLQYLNSPYYHIICYEEILIHPNSSQFLNLILNNFNIHNKIYYIKKNSNIYKGNFIYVNKYLKNSYNYNNIILNNLSYKNINIENLNYENSKWFVKKRIIIDKLIELANNLYKNKNIETYDRIWLSRRDLDINTYWHKRFITNINDVVPLLEKYNFKEMIFNYNNNDLLKQIYIINNCSVIFSEMGAGISNIFFLKENAKVIALNDPNVEELISEPVKEVCKIYNLKLYYYDKILFDIDNIYYKKILNSIQEPLKINDVNEFTNWFENAMI